MHSELWQHRVKADKFRLVCQPVALTGKIEPLSEGTIKFPRLASLTTPKQFDDEVNIEQLLLTVSFSTPPYFKVLFCLF